MKKLKYKCTLTKMASQIGIQLWQAMEMMKYCSYKNHGNSMCMDCGKVFRTAEQSKHNCPRKDLEAKFSRND